MLLDSGVTGTTYTKTSATEGLIYQFKVQARNVVGDSADFSTVSILAASIPAPPSARWTVQVCASERPLGKGEIFFNNAVLKKIDSTKAPERPS